MKLADLAAHLPLEVIRDGEFDSLGLLTSSAHATLACLHDPARAGDWQSNKDVSCVITSRAHASMVPGTVGLALASAPREAFVDVQRYVGESTELYGAPFESVIASDASVDASASVAVMNVRIESGAVVEAGAVIQERVTLGPNVIVRAGAVIGAGGFHPVPYGDAQVNMPHYGSVVVGERAEIGANSVICRSVFSSPTSIGAETILGPMVYIAHGTAVGARCRIAAGARICGSSTLGDDVFVGPNAVVANLIHIGNGARVSIGSVVVRDINAGDAVSGHFAIEHGKFLEIWNRLFR